MLAVKGNIECKILDIQKNDYLERGFTILDENKKIIATPSDVSDIEKENKELKKKLAEDKQIIAEYEQIIAEIQERKEPTIAELKAKLDKLGIEYDKKATKNDLLKLLQAE